MIGLTFRLTDRENKYRHGWLSVTTTHFFVEIMSTLMAIKCSFKRSYDKQNTTRAVISSEISLKSLSLSLSTGTNDTISYLNYHSNSVKHVFVIFAFYLPLQKTRKIGLCDEKTCFGQCEQQRCRSKWPDKRPRSLPGSLHEQLEVFGLWYFELWSRLVWSRTLCANEFSPNAAQIHNVRHLHLVCMIDTFSRCIK